MDITEQKQLAVQRQRAARVEGIGQLAAGIAHNFNNLLAVVIPNIELELSANPAAGSAGLTAALDAALQARDLVRNLLLLTQRDPSHPPTPSDPLDVVARVVGICRVTFPREIALRHQVATPLGFVSMPVADLEQVLLNLLLNARDAVEASPAGPREIAIEVRLVVTDAGLPMVQLRVKDSGIGMSQDVRARLFEPFFTTKPPHKGSGLGLANVAERVRSAGGTVQCESAPGKGTTFTILLPVVSAPRPTPRPAAAPPTPAPSPADQVVLLVDDEPLVRRTVRRLLERDGYTVQEAANAQEARQALQRGRVNLVILDQSMPGEAGIHAFPSLRALTDAPIVLFTGMVPAVPEGFAAVLEKPARPEDLRRMVLATLGPR
jgi:CheY-like chemotaxis protein